MGLLDFLIPRPLKSQTPSIPYSPVGLTQLLRGVPTWQGANAESLVNDGYSGNATVYSIVKLITDKGKVPPWNVYKEKDKAKAKMYRAKMQRPDRIENWNEIMKLKEEAYEIYEGDQRLNELLKYPNSEDTWSDLIEQVLMYKLVTGNSFTYAKIIEAGANMGKPFSLHSLPSQYMSIIVDIDTFPAEKVGYQLYFGKEVSFLRNEILQDKFANPTWSVTGAELYGLAPLKAAAKDLTRNNASSNSIVSAYANEAPIGIISPKMGQSFDPNSGAGQMQALKSEIANKSGSDKRGLLPITSYEMVFTPIGFTPEDMQFIQSQKWDKEQLCAVFGVPPPLLGSSDGAIYNNMKEMSKALVTRCVLPNLVSYRDNFNRMLDKYWGYRGTGLFIDFDTSCYPELEADRGTQVSWLANAWWLTPAQKLQVMNIQPDENIPMEDLHKWYLPSSIQPLDDFKLIDPTK
jgi:HK97 family phage portal protein